jgi:hypothetical protein
VIPAAEFGTASATLLPLFPSPLLSIQQSLQNGTIRNTPEFSGCCPYLDRDAYTVKIDHVLTDKQKIWGSYMHNWRDRYNRSAATFPPFPGWPINPQKMQDVGGPQIRLADAWNITDRSLNEIQFGYNRFQNKNGLSDDVKYFPSSLVGVPNTCFPGVNLSSSYIPGIPKALGHSCDNIDPSESFVLQDYYSYLRAKHSLKFGVEYRKYRYNTFEPDTVSGGFNFLGTSTALPGFETSTGNPYASFIVGAVNNANRQIYPSSPHYRGGLYAFFAQDDFKATPKLTLNLGLRWEIAVPQWKPTITNRGSMARCRIRARITFSERWNSWATAPLATAVIPSKTGTSRMSRHGSAWLTELPTSWSSAADMGSLMPLPLKTTSVLWII